MNSKIFAGGSCAKTIERAKTHKVGFDGLWMVFFLCKIFNKLFVDDFFIEQTFYIKVTINHPHNICELSPMLFTGDFIKVTPICRAKPGFKLNDYR